MGWTFRDASLRETDCFGYGNDMLSTFYGGFIRAFLFKSQMRHLGGVWLGVLRKGKGNENTPFPLMLFGSHF